MKDYFNLVLGSGTSVTINEETALTISTVFACVNYRAGALATLPFNVRKRLPTGGDEMATTHDQYYLLKEEPNQLYDSSVFLFTLGVYRLLWGNGYAFIHRSKGRPIKYELVHPKFVDIEEIDGALWYIRSDKKETVHQRDVIHVKGLSTDGLKGKSVIQAARENLTGLSNMDKLFTKLMQNGSFNDKYITMPEFLKDDAAFNRLAKSWADKYSGPGNAGKPILLEGGATLHAIGMPLPDMQYIENKKLKKQDIAMLFGVPLAKLADIEYSKNTTLSEQNAAFVTDFLRVDAVMMEREFNRKIFRESEKRTHFVKIELKGLLRGTPEQRAAMYKELFYMAAISPNEIRGLEDMNPIKGGDEYYMQANLLPLSRLKEYIDAKIEGGAKDGNIKKSIHIDPELLMINGNGYDKDF